MATVNTNDLRVKNAENLIDSLVGQYIFIGRPDPWDVDVTVPIMPRKKAGDQSPPYPDNNWKDYYRTWNQMLALKRIDEVDVHYVLPRVTWTSGVVYDMYRHDYNQDNKSFSNAKNLYDCIFFVVNQFRNVYVCLNNSKNRPSQVEPLSTGNEPFYTSDGYQWIRMYDISMSQMRRFSTNNLIPVVDNNANYLPEGAVYTVKVESAGDEILMDKVTNYYCNITGDGHGAVAKVIVKQNKVAEILVERNGEGYTYGMLDFVPGRVYASIFDLDRKQNGLNPGGDKTFKSTVIMSPPGGWGFLKGSQDPMGQMRKCRAALARQLGAHRVCVFSTLKYDTTDFTTQGQFRQVGILQDGEPIAETPPGTLSACSAMKLAEPLGLLTVDFKAGETIFQEQIDADDPSIKYTAKGTVVGWDSSTRILRYVQDPYIHMDSEHNQLYPFKNDDPITGGGQLYDLIPDILFNGELEDLTFVSGYASSEVKRYRGLITYLSNQSPIQRDPSQTERVSLLISY